MGVLVSLFALWGVLASAHAACTCNKVTRPAARAKQLNVTGPALGNVAQETAAISLALLGPTKEFSTSPGAAQKIAVVSAVVFDAYAFAYGEGKTLTNARSGTVEEADREMFVGYAAYFALTIVLAGEDTKLALLHSRMYHLGYDAAVYSTHPAIGGVRAVLKKYMLKMPMGVPEAENAPSKTFDATCDLAAPDAWQAQCVQMEPGMPCMPQKIPFAMLYNATLFTAEGTASIYASQAAVPPVFDGGLEVLPKEVGLSPFADEYLEVLKVSGELGDAEKASAEFFQPPAFVTIAAVALNEAVARELGMGDSAALMFGVTAAARDGAASSVTLKLSNYATRPVTVLQCGLLGEKITAWNEPYYGVRSFVNGEDGQLWRPYLQTPGHPGWVSGHATVAAAGAEVLARFLGSKVQGGNCGMVMKGMSKYEPMVLKGAPGYIAGVTDVPNKGAGTVGYSPAEDVKICWGTFSEYADKLKMSRLYGGIHISKDNDDGAALGKIVGKAAYEYLMTVYTKEVKLWL